MQEVIGSTPLSSTKKPQFWGFFCAVYFLHLTLRLGLMQFYVYILYSTYLDRYYIGHTQNIEDRLRRHNGSGSKSTKKANDWNLVYKEKFCSRAAAMRRELEIKRSKSRKVMELLINSDD